MAMSTNDYGKTYTSFSGADILISVGGKIMGELQGISYSITREKAPLYTLGSPDPRSFSRGKRGISGSLIFLVFNKSPLPGSMPEERVEFIGDSKEGQISTSMYNNNLFQEPTAPLQTIAAGTFGSENPIKSYYADQIPPFDALIRASNEYGHTAFMEIIGIEILNTGSGMSVDDITIDESHTYVARRIKKWYNQQRFAGSRWAEDDYLGASY